MLQNSANLDFTSHILFRKIVYVNFSHAIKSMPLKEKYAVYKCYSTPGHGTTYCICVGDVNTHAGDIRYDIESKTCIHV